MNEELNIKLDELFRWKGEVNIFDGNGEVIKTVYMRVISDEDVRKTRIQALKESRQLRQQLLNRESDEYLAFVPMQGDLSRDEMMANILLSRYTEFQHRADSLITERRVKPPKDEATLEEHEEYIEELTNARKEYLRELSEKTGLLIEEHRKVLDAKDDDALFAEYEKSIIDRYCAEKMNSVYNEHALLYGTYIDPEYKVKAFKDINDVREVSMKVKQQLIDGYLALQIGLNEAKK